MNELKSGLFDIHKKEVKLGDFMTDNYTKLGTYEVVFESGAFRLKGTPRGDILVSYAISCGSCVI